MEWSCSRAPKTPSKNRVCVGTHVALRGIPYIWHPHGSQLRGDPAGDAFEAADPSVLALHKILVVGTFVLPQLLLGLQILGQGPLPGLGLRERPLKTLQLQLQIFDGVIGLGELLSLAEDCALRLHQGTVERVLLLGQLQGLVHQPVPLHLQLLYLAGVNQSLGIECLFVPLLQLLGPLHNKLLHLLILDTECCGKPLLASGKVLLLGV